MLKNYIKIAIRNLRGNPIFSFINIFGLAAGLATCLLIMLYIFSELGYDQQHQDAGRIYRIASAAQTASGVKGKGWAATSAPVSGSIKANMPEVEESARLLKFPTLEKMLLKYEQGRSSKQFYETNGYYVDSNFFRIFTYAFQYGNAFTALNDPNSIVISEEVSQKMFGNENPVGKSISIGMPFGNFNYAVTGVFKDRNIKSHIPAHFYLSMHNGDIGTWAANQTNWATNNIFHTYVKLKKGVDPNVFEKKLNLFVNRQANADLKALGVTRKLFIQPLENIYLHSDLDNEIAANGNQTFLNILGIIALFVLLIASINFMNLSTARSGKRAKEVGVRKVLGAEKRSLIFQFLGESIIMCCLALLLAVCLASVMLPFFNSLTQKSLKPFDEPRLWFWITGLTLVTGIISGLYPAFYLSAFRPISVLKGKLLNNFSAVTIRKGLVIFQFTISITLILGAIVIERQLHFLDSRDLGFNKSQLLIVPMQNESAIKQYNAFKDELLKNPDIKKVTSGSTYPGIANVQDMLYYAEGKSVRDVVDINLGSAENDYFETLGFTLLNGRGFSKEFTADSNSIVLNEAAIQALGYDPKTAIGKKIYYDFQGMHGSLQIIGVLKNFNFESLYNTIKPFGFTNSGNKYNYVIAGLRTNDYPVALKSIEQSWKKINPGLPFVYSFLDKDFQQNYEKDQRTSGIVGYFTIITILIACLGLFGLSAFSAEQRTREIGIRKVLGASAANVTALLSREFIGLVFISLLIASPLAWYYMNDWLNGFAYKIRMNGWMFLAAGLMAVFIASVTISFQAIKAALSNPAKSLRAE